MPTIKEYLDVYMNKTEIITESKALDDDSLVQLSILNFGTILPNKVAPEIRKKLEKFGYLDNKGLITPEGKTYLKDKKTIKRLKDIAN